MENWLTFFLFLTMMSQDYRIGNIVAEVANAGYSHHNLTAFKQLYWDALSKRLRNDTAPGCGIMVGGKGERVVIDEGSFGKNSGISKGPRQPSGRSRKSAIAKKLPAQTIWKKGAKMTRAWTRGRSGRMVMNRKMIMKVHMKSRKKEKQKIAMKAVKKLDGGSHGNWVWCAVEVGSLKGGRKTHGDGTKRVAISVLPRPSKAPDGKPRGIESIKTQLDKHVRKGSTVIFDGWTATKAATEELGYRHPPPVVHKEHFRDPATGYHTNDAESEMNRAKSWCRKKYAFVRGNSKHADEEDGSDGILSAHMDEYVYRTNIGDDFESVMKAFQFVGGGAQKAVDI